MEKSTTVKVATLIEPTKAYDSKLTPLPVDDIPPTSLKVDPTFQMPLSTIYATINDRVGEKTIEGIIKLNEKGLSPSEIRAKGIGLTEQIIETIINDCASAPNTDTPSESLTEVSSDPVASIVESQPVARIILINISSM